MVSELSSRYSLLLLVAIVIKSMYIMANNVSHIPLPAPLNTSANVATEWKRFKGQWQNYVKAAKIDDEEADRQAAIFLAFIGSDAYNVFTTMELSDAD